MSAPFSRSVVGIYSNCLNRIYRRSVDIHYTYSKKMSLLGRCGSCAAIPGLMAEVINIILYHLTTELKPDEVGIIWDISGDKKQKCEIWLTIQLLPPQISYIILIISQAALSLSAAENSFCPCWLQLCIFSVSDKPFAFQNIYERRKNCYREW